MAEPSRYSISEKGAGMEGSILKNKLEIKNQKTLDDAETLLLADAYTHFFNRLDQEGLMFDLPLLFEIHKYFLGPLYTWAGKVRQIDISKDDVLFAPAQHLQNSLKEFEPILKKHIPTLKDSKKFSSQKLAVIHDELNALHPFREGNGRAIRLFLDLLAKKSGYNSIVWDKVSREGYLKACKKGMMREHDAMVKVIYKALQKN